MLSFLRTKSCYRPGIFAGILGGIGISATDAFAQILILQGFKPFQVMFFCGFITLLGTTILLIKDKSLPFPHKARRDLFGWSAAGGFFCFVHTAAVYYAFEELVLSEAIILASVTPIFSTLISKIVLKEAITWYKISACVLILLGVLISFNPTSLVSLQNKPSLWIARVVVILSSLCESFYIVSARWLSKEETHYASQCWWQACMSTIFAPVTFYFDDFQRLSSANSILLMLGVGLCGLIGDMGINYALSHENATLVGIISSFDIVYSLLWQAILIKSDIMWYQGVAICIILLAFIISAIDDAEEDHTKVLISMNVKVIPVTTSALESSTQELSDRSYRNITTTMV